MLGTSESENALLVRMTPSLKHKIEPHMKRIHRSAGDVLIRSGEVSHQVWFPRGPALAAISLLESDENYFDVSFIGREGVISGMGGLDYPSYTTAYVLFSGAFDVLDRQAIAQNADLSPEVTPLLSVYCHQFTIQALQSVACRSCHSIEQRLARLIIGAAERTGAPEIAITQEQIARMLGLGRTFVNRAIGKLKKTGAVRARRGNLIISDMSQLEKATCSCSQNLKGYFDRQSNPLTQ